MADGMVTLIGNIGQEPEYKATARGDVLNFSIAVTERFRGDDGTWTDGLTSWVRVSAWDDLARHGSVSLHRGQRVIVHASLRVAEFTTREGTRSKSVEIKAASMGHDLTRGTAAFTRVPSRSAASAAPGPAPEPERQQSQLVAVAAGDAAGASEDAWASPMSVSRDPDDVPF